MSQTETHFGKLRKIKLEIPLEEWFKEKCIEKGIDKIPSYNDSWEETFRDNYYNEYFIIDGQVWESFEHIKSDGYEDIDVMIPNDDGTITFVQQFYNGGTCLSECIEEGLKKLKLNKK
jgi:hypothetical protein